MERRRRYRRDQPPRGGLQHPGRCRSLPLRPSGVLGLPVGQARFARGRRWAAEVARASLNERGARGALARRSARCARCARHDRGAQHGRRAGDERHGQDVRETSGAQTLAVQTGGRHRLERGGGRLCHCRPRVGELDRAQGGGSRGPAVAVGGRVAAKSPAHHAACRHHAPGQHGHGWPPTAW